MLPCVSPCTLDINRRPPEPSVLQVNKLPAGQIYSVGPDALQDPLLNLPLSSSPLSAPYQYDGLILPCMGYLHPPLPHGHMGVSRLSHTLPHPHLSPVLMEGKEEVMLFPQDHCMSPLLEKPILGVLTDSYPRFFHSYKGEQGGPGACPQSIHHLGKESSTGDRGYICQICMVPPRRQVASLL